MDPPIYLCENPQSHSVCSTCHESLKKERKPCPVCRQEMKSKRNVTLEGMLENIPNKTKCNFNGCDFKRSDAEAVKKHEDECENRYVPCARCDEKISMRGLAQHVVEEHSDGDEFKVDSFGDVESFMIPSAGLEKNQSVTSVAGGHKFLENWCSLDDDLTLFWVAYIGQKGLSSKYRYTLQVRGSKKEIAFLGARNCIPCDLSHADVKKKKWALVLDKDLLADATKEDDMLHYALAIDEILVNL